MDVDHTLFIVVASTLLFQQERVVFFSQPSQLPSTTSSSVRMPQAARQWGPTRDRHGPTHDRPHKLAYVDRDDPRHWRAETSASRGQTESRRRSRSPQTSRRTNDDAARSSESSSTLGRSVPWTELRSPAKDQESPHAGLLASPASTSKMPMSKHAVKAASKRVATDISKWNRKQAELHANEPLTTLASGKEIPVSVDPCASVSDASVAAQSKEQSQPLRPSRTAPRSPQETADQCLDAVQMSEAQLASYDYKDLARIACLLCQRKFKSLDTLQRHENESQLHKENLAKMEICRQGVIRKNESRNDAVSHASVLESEIGSTASLSMPAYRDRASERRAIFGANTPSKSSHPSSAPKVFEGPESTTGAPPTTVQEIPLSAPAKPIDSDNVGSKLLAMMGWTHGQGLGLQKQGRTDIVETKIYKPGAGLGSIAPTDAAAHEAISTAAAHRRPESDVAFSGYLNRAKEREYTLVSSNKSTGTG